ncbi:MAG TPA: dihydrolipoamide acetyltransferase family protein, partial [Ilumatobacteraceae bacterium]
KVLRAQGTTTTPERPAPQRATPVTGPADDTVDEVKVIGLRRNIAQRMDLAKTRIPHFTYVEEVDVTEIERLRTHLNQERLSGESRLTVLPFLMRATVISVVDFPQINARYDDDNGVVNRHRAVHLGIATQTSKGLMVPVVKHAEGHDLWGYADEIARLSVAARNGSITLEELTGSTITISSLGALGGIAATPIINYPEVAIIGVNKVTTRPVYIDGALHPRQIMNLSSSFDHRVVDGADAAAFIQRVRALLETPALLFMP